MRTTLCVLLFSVSFVACGGAAAPSPTPRSTSASTSAGVTHTRDDEPAVIERVVEEPRATSTDELVQVAQTDATTSDAQTDLPPSEPAAPIADLEERGRFRFPPNGRHPRARGQVIETLAALARELEAQEPGQGIQEVVLTGHAEEGERNVTELAEMRAEMIKRIMLQEGIDPQIIRVAPVGLAGRTVVLSLRR